MKNLVLSVCLVGAALIFCAGHAAAQGWTLQNSGTAVTLYEVLMVDANSGTAVGASGTVLCTTNGGVTWNNEPTGVTTDLFAVDFSSGNTEIVVGNGGLMLRSTDCGDNWTVLPQITADNLRGISFAEESVGTVVGTTGIILRSTNSGSTWTPIRGISVPLYEVSFVTADIGTVVGASGTILRTTDGGLSWTPQNSGTSQTLFGISFAGVNLGVAVGGNGVIRRTTNGGASWNSRASGTTATLTSVFMVDNLVGYIVGDAGTILRSTDGGASWTPQSSGTTSDLKEVSFTDAQTGTVVGSGGVILRTTSGGEPALALALLSPNGGENFTIGSSRQITWNATGFANVKIELSRNNGTSWQTLAAAVPAGSLSYTWTVTGPASTLCKIRISDSANSGLNDITEGVFTISATQVTASYPINEAWNLVSVPLTVQDYARASLYPTAISVAYSYDPISGYVVRDTLRNSVGYWLKFDSTQSVSMTGYPRDIDTVSVSRGWNIIGSISAAVPVSSIISIPPGNIQGVIYGFDGTYFEATAIEPGKAYWVKVSVDGQLILATP